MLSRTLAVIVLVIAARVAAEHSETIIVDDPNEQVPPWRSIIEGNSCANNPNAPGCQVDEAQTKGREDSSKRDMQAYAAIVTRFEGLTNDWCCATTGKPLYTVSGDQDVMNYLFLFLSQVFDTQGQQYGSRMVVNYHVSRQPPEYNCVLVPLGSAASFSAPVEALLLFREMLTEWMQRNEVDPAPVLSQFIPNTKQLYGKFVRSRLLFARDVANAQHWERAVAEILPLTDAHDYSDYCAAGGDLLAIVRNSTGTLKHEIDVMIQSCIDNGKLAENPADFGSVLLEAGRENEARQLFDLAVERGVLCNAWQRPDHHRKDLIARPIWPSNNMIGMEKAFGKMVTLAKSRSVQLRAAIDVESVKTASAHNTWVRVPIFSQLNGFNETLCEALGSCDVVQDVVARIKESNDAYELICNGSLTVELWAVSGASRSERSVGATNIVLQAIAPISAKNDLVLQIGEDTAQVRSTADAPLFFDDSFEHSFSVAGDGADVNLFIHAQLCHPDLHERVLDTPSNDCATMDDEFDL
jgi:hypothetical protein